MSIDKRGENSWRFRIKHKRKLYTMNFQGTEREAKEAHMIFKADVVAGRVSLVKNITMNQLADTVYTDYVLVKLKVNTQKVYETAYNKYILPEFGIMDIKDIKPIHIQKFANKIAKKLKPSTVGNILACLSKTLSFAEKWEMIELSPYRSIEYQRPSKNNQNELMPLEEIETLVDYYANKEENLMHKSAFCLAIGCGMRNSEIRALETTDIDFQNSVISISKQIGQIRNKGSIINVGVYKK